jgi:hypothetical protein
VQGPGRRVERHEARATRKVNLRAQANNWFTTLHCAFILLPRLYRVHYNAGNGGVGDEVLRSDRDCESLAKK